MRKLNAPGDSVQDVFSTCIESYRDAALKNRLRSIVPVLSDEASRFEDCVLTSKTHTIPTAEIYVAPHEWKMSILWDWHCEHVGSLFAEIQISCTGNHT